MATDIRTPKGVKQQLTGVVIRDQFFAASIFHHFLRSFAVLVPGLTSADAGDGLAADCSVAVDLLATDNDAAGEAATTDPHEWLDLGKCCPQLVLPEAVKDANRLLRRDAAATFELTRAARFAAFARTT